MTHSRPQYLCLIDWLMRLTKIPRLRGQLVFPLAPLHSLVAGLLRWHCVVVALLVRSLIVCLEARLVKRPEIEGASQLVMDLPVVSGFSGAPIADLKGRVYGLVTEGIVGKRNSRGAPISKLLQLMKESGV